MTTEEELNLTEENIESDELYKRLAITVDKGQEPLRIDKFVMARMEGATRNRIQQALHAGLITVDGQTVKPNFKIKPGHEIIVFSENEPINTEIIPEPMDLNIVFEDEDILVINKPAGLVVHPGSGNATGTLVNGVAHYLMQKNPELTEFSLPRFG